MQIITPGNPDYLKFFSLARQTGEKHVASRFLLRGETEDGTLLCNTLTGELALLSFRETAVFDSTPVKNPDYPKLLTHRFLVPENCSETKTAEQLRTLMLKRKDASGVIRHYNILPTTFCNARCFYCYEKGIRQIHMSAETAEQLVSFIAAHHGGKTVELIWFGGEPTIGTERIDQICRGLDGLQVLYKSAMVSNAYLFDEPLIRHARETWNLKGIQITLDGTEEIYNRIKAYAGIRDNPYQRVMRNIGLFLQSGIRVNIRLNLGPHNADDLTALIGELSDRFRDARNLKINVNLLNQYTGTERHDTEKTKELEHHALRLRELLKHNGWSAFRDEKLPSLKISSCMADEPASVQCTPEGILSKCEDQIYEHTVGTLTDGITDRKEVLRWRERTFYEGCETCSLYPSCTYLLANCPVNKQGKCPPGEREERIAGYRELMLKKYEEWKKTEREGKTGKA